MKTRKYTLSVTTQGPTYPPSEIMNGYGDFVVIGILNLTGKENNFYQEWGSAIISKDSPVPKFGDNIAYRIIKRFDYKKIRQEEDCVLYTLPLPLPCNNYPVIFAPEQDIKILSKPSFGLHEVPIPDLRPFDGRKRIMPIKLSDWVKAKGELYVTLVKNQHAARFEFVFKNLIPNSLYTIMALRELDLDPIYGPTRPGPLGVPNVFITDAEGRGVYDAIMPNPFSLDEDVKKRNRIINVVVLWMSKQMSYGGAIGHYGLGGDIHAQLKLVNKSFTEFVTN